MKTYNSHIEGMQLTVVIHIFTGFYVIMDFDHGQPHVAYGSNHVAPTMWISCVVFAM